MRILAFGLLPSLIFGCGEQMDPSPDAGAALTVETLCAQIAEADCARLESCNLLYPPITKDLCIERQTKVVCEPHRSAYRAAIAEREVEFLALSAERCLAHVRTLPCDVGLGNDPFLSDECRNIVQGIGGIGAGCTMDRSCGDGLYCSNADRTCPGTCRPWGGSNDPCGNDALCGADFFCATLGARCIERASRGAPCESSLHGNSCKPGSYCDFSLLGQPTCVQVRGRNGGCTNGFQCAEGLSCFSGLCSAGEEGDTCRIGLDCAPGLLCFEMRCRVPTPSGETCAPDGKPCAEGQTCSSSTTPPLCAPLPILGQSCTDACYLSRCSGGTCVPSLDDGATCADSKECHIDRVCFDDACTHLRDPCSY